MAIADYFSTKFGSSVLPGQGDYSGGFAQYGKASLWRPSAGSLDLGELVKSTKAGGAVTGSLDGSAPASDWLKTLAGAVLDNIGAQAEPQMQPTPVAYRQDGGGGFGLSLPVIALAAVVVGGVIYAAQS